MSSVGLIWYSAGSCVKFDGRSGCVAELTRFSARCRFFRKTALTLVSSSGKTNELPVAPAVAAVSSSGVKPIVPYWKYAQSTVSPCVT